MKKEAPERCPTCKRLKKRSHEANARYWLLIHAIADKLKPEGVAHAPATWHLYMKQRYLGVDEVTLPNKNVIQYPRSSAELDKDEFNEYMGRVEEWAMEHDVYLPELEESR